MFKRLLANRHGNISTAFAIAAIPVVVSAGAVVDYARAYDQEAVARQALESTAREANRLASVLPPEEVEKAAAGIYASAVAGTRGHASPLDVSVTGESVTIATRLSVPTTFLGLLGIDEIGFDMSSRSVASNLTYEVALVLDSSGSMAGSRIAALRTAAGNLVSALFAANIRNPARDPVRIAVVPFAASVNVGPDSAGQPWLDGKGGRGGDRFALFDALPEVSWAGCVEARSEPYDVDDAPSDPAVPATMFVPMFAPDEPDLPGFDNSYLADSSAACTLADRRRTTLDRAALAQARLCKYRDAAALPEGHRNGTVIGPNLNCTSAPLAPLSSDRSTVLSAIDALRPRGMTHIHEGVMWGWRTLSPSAPFTEGRPYDDGGNRKILIVMTDGENSYDTYPNFNRSMYGAYGYLADGSLGAGPTDRAAVVARMNERTITACDNAKAGGKVLVYTVAFRVSDPATLALLADCASAPHMAFRSDSGVDLAAAFADISNSIAMLRVTD